MAKTPFETLTKLEKIKPKGGLQRRNSTGGAAIFNDPIPIRNYLRASIGSCHDLSKYGKTLDSTPQKSELRRNINLKLAEAKSNASNRVKKVPESKNLGFPSSRKKPSETLKGTFSARAGQNGEIKKRTSPLPRSPLPSPAQASAKIPVPKTRRSMSLPRKIGPAKPLERPERRKKPERESVEEKIEEVLEAKDEDLIEAKDENQNEGFVSSLDEKQEMDSEGNDSSPKKVEPEPEREEEVLESENKEDGGEEEEEVVVSEEKGVLRRAFSEGDFDNNNKEKESVRIVVNMGKEKVKALVHAFEALIIT